MYISTYIVPVKPYKALARSHLGSSIMETDIYIYIYMGSNFCDIRT